MWLSNLISLRVSEPQAFFRYPKLGYDVLLLKVVTCCQLDCFCPTGPDRIPYPGNYKILPLTGHCRQGEVAERGAGVGQPSG